MSPSTVSLTTIFVIVAIGVAIGFLAGVHRKMDLEQNNYGECGSLLPASEHLKRDGCRLKRLLIR